MTVTFTSSALRMNNLVSEMPLPAGCWWHHRSDIAVQSGVGMSLCDLTAGRCHVVYSTGITAPNLPLMKTQLEKKRERSWWWSNKWRMLETRWKKEEIDFWPHDISSLAVWRATKTWRVRLSSECTVCMWACAGLHVQVYSFFIHLLFKYIWVRLCSCQPAHKHTLSITAAE